MVLYRRLWLVCYADCNLDYTNINIRYTAEELELNNIVTHRMQEERIPISREHNSWDYMYNCFETIF